MNIWRAHRKKLLWASAISGTVYLIGRYAKSKFYELQERAMHDRLARDNLQRRFEQNQQDCAFTVLALLPELSEAILSELNAEKITAILQQQKNSSSTGAGEVDGAEEQAQSPSLPAPTSPYANMTKLELWNELKVTNFTRLVIAMYSVSLLSIFTRVQLNLIGRLIYLDSVAAVARHPDGTLDTLHGRTAHFLDHNVEQMYLTFSWWYLNVGWKACCARVRDAVEKVIGGLSLKRTVTSSELALLFSEIRARVEKEDFSSLNSAPFNFAQFLVPPESQECEALRKGGADVPDTIDGRAGDHTLRDLLDETRDRLESPDFTTLLSTCMDNMSAVLMSHLATVFRASQQQQQQQVDAEIYTAGSQTLPPAASVALAALLPALKAEVHHILNGVPNEYLSILGSIEQLRQYSLLVYTDYDVGELR
ncbi:peroxin [Sorochytrium milnesiophthora]